MAQLDTRSPGNFSLATWALLVLASVLALAPVAGSVGAMVDNWLGSEEYSHGLLIPPIVAYLIWQQRATLLAHGVRSSYAGLPLIGLGLLFQYLGKLSSLQVVEQLSVVIVSWGLVATLGGYRLLRELAVPLLLLLLMVPLPQFLLQNLSASLQLLSSRIGVSVMRLFDISVFLDGNIIDLGIYKLEVAQACSGLRYLFPMMTIALIIAYLFKAPIWKRLLVFLSSVPITIIMNSLRIAAIGIMVEFWGQGMAEGFLHDFEGWAVFMAGVGVMLVEVFMLARLGGDRRPWRLLLGIETASARSRPAGQDTGPAHWPTAPMLAGSALVATMTAVLLLMPARAVSVPQRVSFDRFPPQLGAWQGERLTMERIYLEQLKLSDYLLADYHRGGAQPINFYVAWYDRQSPGESVHSPRSCLPGGGWRISEFQQRELRVPGPGGALQALHVNRALITYAGQRDLVYYWFQQRGHVVTNEYLVKWYLLWDAVTRNRTDGALVRLVMPLREGQSAAEADAPLHEFIAAMAPQLARFVPG
jgi:exosortase D (VPLPA-CTERM-specific)